MSKSITKKSVKLKDDVKLSKLQKKQVKTMVKGIQQLKYFNYFNVGQLIDWAGAVVKLSSPIQGQGDTQRIGDTIKCTSLNLSYSIANPSAGTTAPASLEQIVRVIVFRWLPQDSTAPILGDVMNTTLSQYAVFTQYNDDKRDQFEVLYDKSHKVSSYQNGFAGSSLVAQHYIKCNKKIEYTTGTTNGTGNIYMLYVSDQNSGIPSGEKALMSYYSTLRYTNS